MGTAGEWPDIMRSILRALSSRYLSALQKYLKQHPRGGLEPARRLGYEAVAAGLGTLDMARIHYGAVAKLKPARSTDVLIARADVFFTETITPIEEAQSATLKFSARLGDLNDALGQRTVNMAAYNRSLRQGIARSKTVEATLRKRVERYKRALMESLPLQKRLERLTHRILSAQEEKRKKISHDLQNEIAQTLLGINVRLLTIQKAAGLNDKSLQKEIASTQRLVDMSVNTIEHFALEYGKQEA
jgi:signal transduction histidine kinase